MQAIERLGIKLRTNTVVDSIKKLENGQLQLNENEEFDFVFIGTGGSAKLESYNWLSNLGHSILTPLPSLFTFNIPDNPLKGLEGLSVVEASVRAEKTNLSATGGWLVTHWGISGPAVLRLSAWGAKELAERNYHFAVFVNFITQMNAEVVRTKMQEFGQLNKQKLIGSHRLFDLPSRLWERMVFLAEIHPELRWCDISKQKLNKLVENLTNFRLEVRGKTTFKEEFVTCGGVSLDELHVQTIESKIVRGLFFGGEVIDIDGITGGFNFQAAWSTAWLAAKEVARRIDD
jgi:predicted Rossmann fold flavoprotein